MANEAAVPVRIPLRISARIRSFEATEDEVIAWYMRGVLDRARGNQCEAQRVHALDRSIIRRRFEKLGLPRRSQCDGHCGG